MTYTESTNANTPVANESTDATSAATTNTVTFDSLHLAEPILRAVKGEGYSEPTRIQREAIPAVLAGGDLIGIAQTGTGKTAAFVLPLLNMLASNRERTAPKTCTALILAPTRELAQQINDSIRTYGRYMRISSTVVVGGAKPGPQIRALAQGIDIVVATPGRLLDHMQTHAVRLDRARFVVLDEADQMMDLGFMPAIRRILGHVPKQRQTLLFSATMPKPIRALANEFLHSPREVAVAAQSRPVDAIDQRVLLVDAAGKRNALLDILRDEKVERGIVFTRTKRGADKVCHYLEEYGVKAAAIHGNKSQGQRERALDAFRQGRVRILVATDIAARGIDIDGVTHVINFEIPNVPESYVHRIGRTARAGATGVAISLCDASERGMMRDIERTIGRSLINPGAQPPKSSGNQPRPEPRHRNEQRNGEHRGAEGRGGEGHRGGGHRGKEHRGKEHRGGGHRRSEHRHERRDGERRDGERGHGQGQAHSKSGAMQVSQPASAVQSGQSQAAAEPARESKGIGRKRWTKRW